MPINLLYHDVTPQGADDSSGFAGPQAARYKLTPEEFDRHLHQIAAVSGGQPSASLEESKSPPSGWTITFDDGGESAATVIADDLERRGWRGWFFIATDFIGTPGFCDRNQIRDLHRRGHVIGSHSCSHPPRISACSPSQLRDEWSRSCAILSDIIGVPIKTASVPGGFYSTDVARSAAKAGVASLFTSEPTTGEYVVEGCRIVGRFNIYRGMSPADAAALLSSPVRRWRQAAFWNVKKVAKTLAGPAYGRLRERWLHRAYGKSCAATR